MPNGSGYERGLRDRHYEHDGIALRIPASGGGTDMDLPDVLGQQETFDDDIWKIPEERRLRNLSFAHELKKTGGETITLGVPECRDLITYARDKGAIPLGTVRFPYDTEFYSAIITHEFLDDIEKKLNSKGEPVQSFRIKKEQRKEMTSFTELMEADYASDITVLKKDVDADELVFGNLEI